MIRIILLALIVSGCAAPCPVIQTTAYPVVPTVAIPEPPHLKIDDIQLSDKERPGIVAQNYVATIEQLKGYTSQLKMVLDEYVKLGKEVDKLKTQSRETENAIE